MGSQDATFRTIQGIERLERIPLVTRLAASSTYELLRETAFRNPDALSPLLAGSLSFPDATLTAHDVLGKLHQTANLLADLGIGHQDTLALLLPDLFETRLLLWGGQAAGIVCPLSPWLPAEHVVELLQAVEAKVLVAPGPQVSQELWRKAERIRMRVKSIKALLQIRGPGNEQDTTYAFNTLLDDYSSDHLCTKREIALDDIALCIPTKKTIGTHTLTPLTHGQILYTAWALSLVTMEEPIEILLRTLSPLLQALYSPVMRS